MVAKTFVIIGNESMWALIKEGCGCKSGCITAHCKCGNCCVPGCKHVKVLQSYISAADSVNLDPNKMQLQFS